MGEVRLKQLESFLPEEVAIFGLDEHTACLLDLEKEEACVKGIGGVTLRRGGVERVFGKGEHFPFKVLQREDNRIITPLRGPGQPAPGKNRKGEL